jgi:hypothetical protein
MSNGVLLSWFDLLQERFNRKIFTLSRQFTQDLILLKFLPDCAAAISAPLAAF